jgi:hypothetical protein
MFWWLDEVKGILRAGIFGIRARVLYGNGTKIIQSGRCFVQSSFEHIISKFPHPILKFLKGKYILLKLS